MNPFKYQGDNNLTRELTHVKCLLGASWVSLSVFFFYMCLFNLPLIVNRTRCRLVVPLFRDDVRDVAPLCRCAQMNMRNNFFSLVFSFLFQAPGATG